MSYPINYPTLQGANVQIFNCNSPLQQGFATWVKPQGANMVWFTLIGSGGGGGCSNGGNPYGGGGSGAVTNLMIPAFLIPDNLVIDVGAGGAGAIGGGNVGAGGQRTAIYTYLNNMASDLLVASAGGGGSSLTGGTGGAASTANFFTAAGFFQSIAGVAGAYAATGASTTTFLSGGGGGGQPNQGNYGYTNNSIAPNSADGFFQMSPIIVGVGANGANTGGATPYAQNSGIGCGGAGSADGVANGGAGGNGLAVIITW